MLDAAASYVLQQYGARLFGFILYGVSPEGMRSGEACGVLTVVNTSIGPAAEMSTEQAMLWQLRRHEFTKED